MNTWRTAARDQLFRFFIATAAALPAVFSVSPASADAPRAAPAKLRVRGAAKLTVHASRGGAPPPTPESPPAPASADRGPGEEPRAGLVFSGVLTDDAGEPLPAQAVTIRVAREARPGDASVAEGLREAAACEGGRIRAKGGDGGAEIIATTDDAGRFCFRARLEPDRYLARVAFAGAGLVDGAARDLSFDLSRQHLRLRFDPTPRSLDVGAPRAVFEVLARIEGEGAPRAAPGLALALASEEKALGRAVTDGSGRARFFVAGPDLGPPGPGELRVAFGGDADIAPSSEVAEIERRAPVTVTVPAAERGELTPGVPEEGISLVAEASSSVGPVGEGTIEARVGEVVVGAAPVEDGSAHLTLTFASPGDEALVKLSYVPSSPWYEPIGEPTITLPLQRPSLASKAPMLVAGLAVLAFFLLGRTRRAETEPQPRSGPTERAPEGKPRLEVVRAERGARGWTGRLLDAHDAVPVRGRVWIERGTFEGRSVLASVETDADGGFSLPDVGRTHGDEKISAEARLHARYEEPLPPAGELVISLAQRRRALLERLVRWARRRGPPFDARPEATPGHVRRAASDEPSTARWAHAIERAAFGPDEVDAQVEADLEELAPREGAAERARGTGAHE